MKAVHGTAGETKKIAIRRPFFKPNSVQKAEIEQCVSWTFAKTGSKETSRQPSARSSPNHECKPELCVSASSTWQNCKNRAEDPPQDRISSKLKPCSTVHRPSNFPPEFYDSLSKVWLAPRTLQELNRRNESLFLPKRKVDHIYIEDLTLAARKGGPDFAHFARTAGPDLGDLRGVCLYRSIVSFRQLTSLLVVRGSNGLRDVFGDKQACLCRQPADTVN